MFDRYVCINLDSRPDRWGKFLAKIDDMAWRERLLRVRAIHGRTTSTAIGYFGGDAAWGCRQSHLRTLEDALLDGIDTLCVFEDDAAFCRDFDHALQQFMELVPDDWQAIMLGGQRMAGMHEILPGVVRSNSTTRTHAYVLRGQAAMQEVYRVWATCDTHIDHWNHRWQQSLACYEPTQFLVGQDEGYSDIAGRSYERRNWSDMPHHPGTKSICCLSVPNQTARELRMIGVHYGYELCKRTGRDRGLIELNKRGYPIEDLVHWMEMICSEASAMDGIAAIWEPTIPHELLVDAARARGLELIMIEGQNMQHVCTQHQFLASRAEAMRRTYLLRSSDRLLLDGLAHHKFHRGHFMDPVTGLDNGLRRAVANQDDQLISATLRMLRREASQIICGKVLLAHPDLTADRLRSLPACENHPVWELRGETLGEVLASAWTDG